MTPLAVGKRFDTFVPTTALGGTATVDADGKLTTTSEVGSVGFYKMRIAAAPGMRIRVSVWCRRLSGSGGGVFIDLSPSPPGNIARAEPSTSGDWELLTVEGGAGPLAGPNTYFQVVMGVPNLGSGTYEFCYPSVSIEGGSTGFAMARLAGLITLPAGMGAPSLNIHYFQTGIESVTWDAGELLVQTSFRGDNATKMGPIIYCELTSDRGGAIFCRAGNFDRISGSFKISFYNADGTARTVLPGTDAYFVWVIGFAVG